jgi:antitoxin FitA
VASLTVRDLDDDLKRRLRIRAAEHGRSMEAEVRAILRDALSGPVDETGLGSRIHQRFAEVGGVDVVFPDRSDGPRAVEFDG